MTVRQVVDQVWARRVAGGRPEWTRGLGPSDIRRGLMEPMALRRVGVPSPARRREDPDRPGGGRLRPEERFDDDDADAVRKWFADEGWDLLITLCGVARTVKDATVGALAGTDALVSGHEVAEWALRKVGGAYWDGIDVPSLADLADPVRDFCEQQIAEGPLRRLSMDERAFTAAVRTTWDATWPAERPAIAPRPSDLGLGGDARPRLEGWRGNWHHGTDRSLYSRYRRYFDASTRVRPPSDPHPAPEHHVTRRFLGASPVEIALTEVHRAAAPLGLAHAGHRAALVSTARGLTGQTGGRRETLDLPDWAARGDDLPAEAEVELAEAVRTYTVGWTARARVASEPRVNTGLREKVVRRLWQRLHGREVEWEVPLSRAGLAADLRDMYYHHLVELHDPPPREEPTSPAEPAAVDPAATESATVGPGATEPGYADRVQATNIAIRDHPEGRSLVDLLQADDPAWQTVYRRITGGRPDLLTLAEFCVEWGILPPEGS